MRAVEKFSIKMRNLSMSAVLSISLSSKIISTVRF